MKMPSLADHGANSRTAATSRKRKISPQDELQFQNANSTANRSILVPRRKIIAPNKRAKTHTNFEDHSLTTTADILLPPTTATTSAPRTKNLSPCHICHRKPTRKADLDAFKDCEGCGQRTCYICIRECNDYSKLDASNNKDHSSAMFEVPEEIMLPQGVGEGDVSNISFEMRDADDDAPTNRTTQPSAFRGASEETEKERTSWRDPSHPMSHRAVICRQCCAEVGSEGETVCLACLDNMDPEQIRFFDPDEVR